MQTIKFPFTVQLGSTPDPLLHAADVSYIGGFRVPNIGADGTTAGFGFAGGPAGPALAFDPTGGLFIIGNNVSGLGIAEISIPTPLNVDVGSMNRATFVQNFRTFLATLPNLPLDTTFGNIFIGGLLVYNNQIIGTACDSYSGATQNASHFKLDSLNLSTANATGLYPLATTGRLAGGYLSAIPSDWQSSLGSPLLTGQADLSIISGTSSGPAAFGFNPANFDPAYTTPAPTNNYVYYDINDQLGPYNGVVSPIQSGISGVIGAVFVPGTRTILFIGVSGANYIGYGAPQAGNYPWVLNGESVFQIWAYDANDFSAVKNGTKNPWSIYPYDVWQFALPWYTPSGGQQGNCFGAAFDPSTGNIYVAFSSGEQVGSTGYLPVIAVFKATVPSGPPASTTPPQIGTLSAWPNPLSQVTLIANDQAGFASMPHIPAGTTMQLVAGNVYPIAPGVTISQVQFFKDGVSLGNGSFTSVQRNQQWELNVSTAGWASGNRAITAKATDTLGNVSSVSSYVLTIA